MSEIMSDKQREKEKKRIFPIIHISKCWAYVKETELCDLARLIEKFDEGFSTVSVIDEAENYIGAINQFDFKCDFPRKEFHVCADFYVEYEDDENALKWKLAELFLDTPRKEIPILREGKIIALGRLTNYFDSYGRWDAKRAFEFSWEWIDVSVAKEFFIARRKILISSDCGFLKGFRKMFFDWLDITVYEDGCLEECLAGNFDLIISGSDLFGDFPMEKWEAHRLYYMLLLETVRRWLNQNGIALYFFSNGQQSVPDIEQKLDRQGEITGGTLGFLREGEGDYFICDGNGFDSVLEEKERMPNFHSGRRCVAGINSCYGKGIYFFGPCTAVGWASYSPDKTIESILQKRINLAGMSAHVVNCATEGLFDDDSANINWLYRLMDTPFSCGDVVIIIANSLYFWEQDKKFLPSNLEWLATPFLLEQNGNKKCFAEPRVGHMNVMGYEIEADYMFEILSREMKYKGRSKNRKSFFSMHPVGLRKDCNLEKWMKKLPINLKGEGLDTGAIAMCANPFTKGHMYLIEEALKRCTFLYVFLLEVESPLQSMETRRKIVERCVEGKPVALISAGVCTRQSYVWNMPLQTFITSDEVKFDPVYDTYTFARFIAPRLNIGNYFMGEDCFDRYKQSYNLIKREMLMEENIKYIELPRLKLEDGREIVTSEIRKNWYRNGWESCRDFLPEEEICFLEKC